MLVTTKSRHVIVSFRVLTLPVRLPSAEKSELKTGEIKARVKQLEEQMEEWCAELQSSETDRSTAIKPPRSTDASSKKN